MEFFDIMEDISAHRVTKTETGDNRIFGVVVGIVDKNYDQKQPGKVCVRIPNRDANSNVLKWAKVVTFSMGANWGGYFIPEVGDEVLVTFEEGNIDKPYVIGCIPKSNSKLVSASVDEKNSIKQIRARNGKSFLKYTDDGQEKAEEDNLRLELFDGHVFIDLDSKTETVVISDKGEKNCIVLDGQDDNGLLRIKTQKRIEISVADSIKLKLDGDNGKISIQCDDIDVKANQKAAIKASSGVSVNTDSGFDVSANKAQIKAGGSVNVKADGTASFGGSAIKIG